MTHVKLEKSQGLDLSKIDSCIGDPEADVENPVLKLEQDAQLIPGKLDKGAVLKAICSGFEETTEPAVCLTDEIETNECLENNGGCRQNKAANITACKIVYILDQVRALEDEMLLRIKRQGLDITPQILIVAGYAIGGGHVLHMVCDLTIAVDNAIFGQTGPKIISAVTGGFTDLSFDVVGYAWQIVNCICTVSYSLTMCQVMDTVKQSTRSGSLNEVSMSFLNNTLSLPFALFLIFMFQRVGICT